MTCRQPTQPATRRAAAPTRTPQRRPRRALDRRARSCTSSSPATRSSCSCRGCSGSPEAFGLFSTAMNVVSILNNVLIAATVQTVSKHVSEDLARAPATLRQGSVAAARARACCSRARCWRSRRSLSERVLLDPMLAPLLAVSAVVVFCYALVRGADRLAQRSAALRAASQARHDVHDAAHARHPRRGGARLGRARRDGRLRRARPPACSSSALFVGRHGRARAADRRGGAGSR